jgi:hypothetical protein
MSPLKTKALRRLSKLTDKRLEASEVFRRLINKTEFLDIWSEQMNENVIPEELLSISEEELLRRIEQMMTWEAMGTLLDGLTPEEIDIFNAAVEGR